MPNKLNDETYNRIIQQFIYIVGQSTITDPKGQYIDYKLLIKYFERFIYDSDLLDFISELEASELKRQIKYLENEIIDMQQIISLYLQGEFPPSALKELVDASKKS